MIGHRSRRHLTTVVGPNHPQQSAHPFLVASEVLQAASGYPNAWCPRVSQPWFLDDVASAAKCVALASGANTRSIE